MFMLDLLEHHESYFQTARTNAANASHSIAGQTQGA
jgi:hypothetical protein